MNKILSNITFLVAIIISIASAYCTVVGIGHVFIYAPIVTMIIASIIELGRVVLLYDLHHFWKLMPFVKKIPGIFMLLIAMTLSSIGIFGYFSSAYSSNVSQVIPIQMEIQQLESNIKLIESEINTNNNQIEQIQSSMKSDSMNKALDVYIQKEYVTKALNIQKDAQKQITEIINENKALNKQISEINKEILDLQIDAEKKAPTLAHLKYFAKVIGTDNDNTVIIFIVMIMLVFDTMAMYLMITSDWIKSLYIKEEQENNIETPVKYDIIKKKKSVKKPMIKKEPVFTDSIPQVIETKEETNKIDENMPFLKNDFDIGIKKLIQSIRNDESIINSQTFLESLSKTPYIVKELEDAFGKDSSIIKKLKSNIKRKVVK